MRRYKIMRDEFKSIRYSTSPLFVDEIKSDTYLAIEDDVRKIIERDLRRIPEFKDYNVAVHQPDMYRFTGIVSGYQCDPADPTAGVVLSYRVEVVDD